jgi:hypothetical protein
VNHEVVIPEVGSGLTAGAVAEMDPATGKVTQIFSGLKDRCHSLANLTQVGGVDSITKYLCRSKIRIRSAERYLDVCHCSRTHAEGVDGGGILQIARYAPAR